MSTISCPYELCAADHHEATTPIRHHRLVSDEQAAHSVIAVWGEDQTGAVTAVVQVTYDDTTITTTPSDAAFWSRLISHGGTWSPAVGRGTADIADDLAVAAEVLHYADPDGIEPPVFRSWRQELTVRRSLAGFFEAAGVEL